MINAVKSIVSMLRNMFDVFNSVVDFVVSFFQDLVSIIKLVGQSVLKIPDYLSAIFPPEFIAIVVLAFSIVVIYKVLGRD